MTPNRESPVHRWMRESAARIVYGPDHAILYEFSLFEEHRALAAKQFKLSVDSFKERHEAELDEMTSTQQEDYADEMMAEYDMMVETLPRLQWYAQFLVAYSSFEHALNQLCRIVKERSEFALSVKDLSGQGIVRAANYLIKVAGVQTPFQTVDWNRALLLGEIRNCIAHRSGEIDLDLENKKSLASRIKELRGLHIRMNHDQTDNQLVLNEEFVQDAIASLRKVLDEIAGFKLYGSPSDRVS